METGAPKLSKGLQLPQNNGTQQLRQQSTDSQASQQSPPLEHQAGLSKKLGNFDDATDGPTPRINNDASHAIVNTTSAPTTTWARFCVLCANLTLSQQVFAWVVVFAGVVLPSMAPATISDGSLLVSALRFCLFVIFALAGYQGFTVVQHAKEQLMALEERHEMLTAKNLKLAARFTHSTRHQQEAQAFIFSSGRFLFSRYGLPRPVAEEIGQIVDLTIRDFIMEWYTQVTDDIIFPNDVKFAMLSAVGELCNRAMGMRLVMFLAADAAEAIRHHLRWFENISNKVKARRPDLFPDASCALSASELEKIEMERLELIDKDFAQTGDLHVACEGNGYMEKDYLRHVSKAVLSRIMQASDFHSSAFRHFAKEMLAATVLLPTLQSVDPALINWAIAYMLSPADDNSSDQHSGSSIGTTKSAGKQKSEEADADATASTPNREGATKGGTNHATENSASKSEKNSHSKLGKEDKGSVEGAEDGGHEDYGWRYYAGIMRSARANEILRDKPAGTFLIRKRAINGDVSTEAEIAISFVDYEVYDLNSSRHRSSGLNVNSSSSSKKSRRREKKGRDLGLRITNFFVFCDGGSYRTVPGRTRATEPTSATDMKGILEAKKLSTLMKLLGDCLCIGMRFSSGHDGVTLEALPWSRPEIQTLALKMALAYNERARIRRAQMLENSSGNSASLKKDTPGQKRSSTTENRNAIVESVDTKPNMKTTTTSKETLQQGENIRHLSESSDSDNEVSSANAQYIDTPINGQTKADAEKATTPLENGSAKPQSITNTIDVLRGIAYASSAERRSELFEDFHSAVNECLTTFGAEERIDEQLRSWDPCVLKLVQSIEALLVNGILHLPKKLAKDSSNRDSGTRNSSSNGGSWSFIRHISEQLPEARMVIDLVEQMPNVNETLNPSFWEPGSKNIEDEAEDQSNNRDRSHSDIFSSTLPSPKSENQALLDADKNEDDLESPWRDFLGKTRAWLLLALNKNFLATHLDVLFSVDGISEKYYAPYAALRDNKDVKDVLAYLDMLLTVDFDINLDPLWQQSKESPQASITINEKNNGAFTPLQAEQESVKQDNDKRPKSSNKTFFGLNVFGGSTPRPAKGRGANTLTQRENDETARTTRTDSSIVTALTRTGFFDPDELDLPKTKPPRKFSIPVVPTKKNQKTKINAHRRETFGGHSLSKNDDSISAAALSAANNVSRSVSTRLAQNDSQIGSRLAGLGISLDDGDTHRRDSAPAKMVLDAVDSVALKANHAANSSIRSKPVNQTNQYMHALVGESSKDMNNDTSAESMQKSNLHHQQPTEDLGMDMHSIVSQDDSEESKQYAAIRQKSSGYKNAPKRVRFSRKSVYVGPASDVSFEQRLNVIVKDKIRRASISPVHFDSTKVGNQGPRSTSGSIPAPATESRHRSRPLSQLRTILKSVDMMPGCKLQLQFRTEVPSFKIIEGQANGPSKHVVYTVNVQAIVCVGSERHPFDWSISRRYRTFYQLHRALKTCYRKIRVSLPSKRNFSGLFGKLNHEFLENRREGLNAYLQRITILPEIGKVDVLLAFLEVPEHIPEWVAFQKKRDIKLANGKETGGRLSLSLSDSHNSPAAFRIDERKKRRKKKKKTKLKQHSSPGEIRARPAANSIVNDSFTASNFLNQAESASSSSSSTGNVASGTHTTTSATATELGLQAFELERVEKHLFALANELFGIDELSIVRRKLIDGAIGVLMVFMKGRSSKWINNAVEQATASDQAGYAVRAIKELLWPNGVWAEETQPYSKEEEARDRRLAHERLIEAIPTELATLLTNERCHFGAQKIFQMLQCPVMVKNLLYTHLDMLLLRLFPSLPVEGLFNARKGLYGTQINK